MSHKNKSKVNYYIVYTTIVNVITFYRIKCAHLNYSYLQMQFNIMTLNPLSNFCSKLPTLPVIKFTIIIVLICTRSTVGYVTVKAFIHPCQKVFLFDISKVTIILTTNTKYYVLQMPASKDIAIIGTGLSDARYHIIFQYGHWFVKPSRVIFTSSEATAYGN